MWWYILCYVAGVLSFWAVHNILKDWKFDESQRDVWLKTHGGKLPPDKEIVVNGTKGVND